MTTLLGVLGSSGSTGHLHRRRPDDAEPRTTNSIAVLRRLTSTTTDPSTSRPTEGHSSDTGSRAGPLIP